MGVGGGCRRAVLWVGGSVWWGEGGLGDCSFEWSVTSSWRGTVDAEIKPPPSSRLLPSPLQTPSSAMLFLLASPPTAHNVQLKDLSIKPGGGGGGGGQKMQNIALRAWPMTALRPACSDFYSALL